jgi:hypothetical protein
LVKRGDLPRPIKLGGVNRWPIRLLEEFESEQIVKHLIACETASQQCRKKRK